MKNAHEFPGLYDDLFDFTKAGYVMIDTSSPYGIAPTGFVRDVEYISDDPSKFWMKGLLDSWHVTARGPLDPKVRQAHCKQVLDSIDLPETLSLGPIEVFPSPYPDEQYDCIVVTVDDPALFELNQQLAVLPGVQTFIPYKPHLTLGYFQAGYTDQLVSTLQGYILHHVNVAGFDFGRMAE